MNKFKKTSFVMVLLLLFALLVMVGLSTSFAADRNITNATDGGISGAVNSSLANDKIILSDGIYSGNNNKDIIINKNLTITGSNKANTVIDLSGGSKLFTINSSVSLILANLTIKNAQIGNNSYLISNNGYLTLQNVNIINNEIENDAGYVIYTDNHLTVIDSTFTNNSGIAGGAIYVSAGNNSTTNVDIVNSTFTNNNATTNGGAVYVGAATSGLSNVNIIDSTFTGNNATGGGSVYIRPIGISNVNITRSNFINNKAVYGGSIAINNYENGTPNVNIIDSTFTNNNAADNGAAIDVGSSANGTTSAYIVNSTFENNTVGYNGGGIVITNSANGTTSAYIANSTFTGNNAGMGGGVSVLNMGSAYIANSTFTGNNVGMGGGVSVLNMGSAYIVNSTFESNTATTSGGAIFVSTSANGTPSIYTVNSTFVNNTATNNGGGIYVTTINGSDGILDSSFVNNTATNGGAIYLTTGADGSVSVDIVNSTFESNTATTSGGAIYVYSWIRTHDSVGIFDSSFVNNTATTSGGAIYVTTNSNSSVSVDIVNSTFESNTATTSGGAIYLTAGADGSVSVDIVNSTFESNTATTSGGAIYVTTNYRCNFTIDVLSSSFINNSAANGKAIYVTSGPDSNVSVVVNYNVFLNQSTGAIFKNGASSVVVDADYNYWGFNGVPTGMTNVVVNSYYVLGITNMSDLGANYTVGDLLNFNYTVYLNGTSDSTNASNLPSLNSIFYNDLLYGYFSLNAPGIIQVPVQTIAGDVFNFTNANGTVIGNFTLTGTIYPGSVDNITVPEIIIVNNTSVDLVISIPTSVGGLAGQTFNVTINGQTQTVAFTNGTGTFVGYQYGNLGLNSLNITLSDNPNYNNSSAINNVFFKEETNINASVNDTVYGENAIIVINATSNGRSIADGTYTVILNGVEYNVTFTNGIGQVILSGLNAGEYNYTIIFNSTDKYIESETNITINVIKANVNIGVNLPSNATYGGNSTISGNLTTNGSLLEGTYNITVTINGVEYNVTVIDGVWSLTIPNTNVGIANIDIFFPENNNYNNATIANSYTVNPKNLGTKITITSTRNGNKITYKITLKDNQGNILTNQNLTLTIAGKTVTLRTNSQGIAQYTFTATKAGKYYANAAYNGLNTENIIYGSSSAKSNSISITKTNIKVYHVAKSAKTVKYHGKRYRVYYKTYYIKNYGILTGSKLFQKSLKGFTLSKISKTSNIKTNYNKTKKILKTSVKNLAHAKIAKIKIKFYKRIA
ncbi:beta strand repeat-containing protein [Methanobrevibacter cuticularis]|nr:hypothetical protein [Methanobrevibacter cuticularis]